EEPSTSRCNSASSSAASSSYLATANSTVEIKNLKKQYVENMKRLVRTCRKQVENLTKEKEDALRKLKARDEIRIKPEKAEKVGKENKIVLNFRSALHLHQWVALQRIDVAGVDIGGRANENDIKYTLVDRDSTCREADSN
ncbi:hypothetical protein PMAYCL1PPCAC_11112, partial [Pristionchus mayeri]